MKTTAFFLRPAMIISALLAMSLLMAGCGSGSSAKNPAKPNTNVGGTGGGFVYKGEKPAATGDVQKFQEKLWINLAPNDRCGGCHSEQSPGQSPMFVRGDDINLAYTAASAIVNLQSPDLSRMVEKVRGGHNCWQADAGACADIIATYIKAWAGDAATSANTIALTAPVEKSVENSKSFPAEPPASYSDGLYVLLKEYCSSCHSESAVTKQQPYFASANIDVAYAAVKTKIRLDNPAASRLVQRLSADFHNCWSDCTVNAQKMEAAIQAFYDALPAPAQIDLSLKTSLAVGLADAFVLSSGGRIDTDLIAKYEFKTGKGSIAYDTSGVEPAANLSIYNDIGWSSAWGIKVKDTGRAQATTTSSRKFYDLIRGSGEYSIETWVIPENVTQGENDNDPARIVTYAGSDASRNFTLGQYEYNYSFLNRTDKSDGNGLVELHTADDDERLQATLQHVVVTFDQTNGRRIYVNGEYTKDDDEDKGAALKDWDPDYAFAIGNEVGGVTGQWLGSIRFVAIHKRAMSLTDIKANYKVGVGAKYLLLFNVSSLIGTPNSFVVFEVQQLDDYGYLFANPFFTNLDGTAVSNVDLKGLRIGINGEEVSTGQVFANLNTVLNSSAMVNGRQSLSTLGTVIELKSGPELDQFFLTFDQINGGEAYDRKEPDAPPVVDPAYTDLPSLIGIHTFAEINATLSYLTGVPQNYNNGAIHNLYMKVQQALPILSDMNGFVAAQQMGITQLAVGYCNALIGDAALRKPYFRVGNTYLVDTLTNDLNSLDKRNAINNVFLKQLVAHDPDDGALNNQAPPGELLSILDRLMLDITAAPCPTGASCSEQERVLTALKASCSAVFGSAVMLVK
ncbi:MAG: LamG domain-containing protein [Pseudomonadota bacterium]